MLRASTLNSSLILFASLLFALTYSLTVLLLPSAIDKRENQLRTRTL